MFNHLAHAGEDHEAGSASQGLLDALTHQPAWLSLLIITFVLFGVYCLLEKLKVNALNRVIAIVPLLILIAILYMEHNPAVSTVVLSVGFVATFLLAFMMMTAQKQHQKHKKEESKTEDETA